MPSGSPYIKVSLYHFLLCFLSVLLSIVTTSIGRIHYPVDLKGMKPVNIKDDSYLPESERGEGISFSGNKTL